MGRTRKTNKHLPRRVYLKHGAYFFVDHEQKWHRLGMSLGEAYRALAGFVLEERSIRTMDDLCDRYQREVLSTYSTREQKTRVPHLVRIKAVFGEMAPPDVTPKDVRIFRDKVGQRVGLEWQRSQLAKKAMMVLLYGWQSGTLWRLTPVAASSVHPTQGEPAARQTRSSPRYESTARQCCGRDGSGATYGPSTRRYPQTNAGPDH